MLTHRASVQENNHDIINPTLDDSQQDDDDEEEEGDVKHDSVELVFISGWVFNFISYATTSTYADVHVEQVTLREGDSKMMFHANQPLLNLVPPPPSAYSHHVVTLHVWFILILTHVVELAEEVEGHHGVQVHHYSEQTHCHHQL